MLENNKINNLKQFFPTLPTKQILKFVFIIFLTIITLAIPITLLFVIVYIYFLPLKSSHPFIKNIYFEKHLKIFYFMLITYIFMILSSFFNILYLFTVSSIT